jgi:uncharacterized membrane protein
MTTPIYLERFRPVLASPTFDGFLQDFGLHLVWFLAILFSIMALALLARLWLTRLFGRRVDVEQGTMIQGQMGKYFMKLLNLAFKRETALPILALLFASAACVALVAGRIVWTGNPHSAFLVWNLFLAWLPLVFALLACDHYHKSPGWNWRFFGFAGAWLLFFPNAPYIITDLIHVTPRIYQHYWMDLILVLLCALTGLVLGFVSLFLMQSLVRGRFGWLAGWIFIAAIAGLSGIGIYLGRFLRFNSWDVLTNPLELYHGIGNWVGEPFANPRSFAFPVMFAAFLFVAYVMLYALTHLKEMAPRETLEV